MDEAGGWKTGVGRRLLATAVLLTTLLGAYLGWTAGGVLRMALIALAILLLAAASLAAWRGMKTARDKAAAPVGAAAYPPPLAPAPPPPNPVKALPAMPAQLGPYRLERVLGQGSMGIVYLGRDPQTGRLAAIKTLALTQAFDADELVEVKERFFREAQTAGRLDHPQIVTVYEAGEAGGLAYLAMEFLAGGDLTPYTKADRLLPLPLVISIVARVADALAYAHSRQVVHRDVKPANLMYEPVADQLKVTDFGVARLTDSSKTRIGMVLGTPSYMSPEQLAGQRVDGRSDLFSLGVTLYQMACGRLPFVGASMGQLMARIANEAPPDIRGLNPRVPACLAAIIERALCKDAGQRYQRGEDMARDLRACLPQAAGDIEH
jgi:eukaryotic-like serine/threonine-protein kinase